ncbi:MAG: hypothetical protein U0Q15_04055 [Kineosporiaceae bacterium]
MRDETRYVCCVCGDPAAPAAWDYVRVFLEEPDGADGRSGGLQALGAHASCLRRVFSVEVELKHPNDR